ncbi:uncharacterized protein G2W53_008012 [Senna tora]|uniref:Uncharacterized protein n=1 Tax=Senna tora TaxID=362788 RepID=A0A834X7P3_9FABA|nr:uncharacterized protein G2W53_008012 [Senna tora]
MYVLLVVVLSCTLSGLFAPTVSPVVAGGHLSYLGILTHTFAGSDGVGYLIHGPQASHMLHLDLNYRHGQTNVTCDYVLNFQTIPMGGQPVAHPPAPGHPLLVPFGYPRDPAGYQVLVWNVRDISLGINRSLVRDLIVDLNPAVRSGGSARGGVWVLYREGMVTDLFRYRHRHLKCPLVVLSRGVLLLLLASLLAMRSGATSRGLEEVVPPHVRSFQADEHVRVYRFCHNAGRFGFFIRAPRQLVLELEVNFVIPTRASRSFPPAESSVFVPLSVPVPIGSIGVLLWSVNASGFDYMCAFVRDLRPSVLIVMERDTQGVKVADLARSLGYSISRRGGDETQPWVFFVASESPFVAFVSVWVAARGIGPISGNGGIRPRERALTRSPNRLSSKDGWQQKPTNKRFVWLGFAEYRWGFEDRTKNLSRPVCLGKTNDHLRPRWAPIGKSFTMGSKVVLEPVWSWGLYKGAECHVGGVTVTRRVGRRWWLGGWMRAT